MVSRRKSRHKRSQTSPGLLSAKESRFLKKVGAKVGKQAKKDAIFIGKKAGKGLVIVGKATGRGLVKLEKGITARIKKAIADRKEKKRAEAFEKAVGGKIRVSKGPDDFSVKAVTREEPKTSSKKARKQFKSVGIEVV